ncbi:serine hydroxymethyltransferase [bacterium]|nr:serine hydroxymethyltransferase [bacterium]
MIKDKIFNLIQKEQRRQINKIGLIPSENNVSPQVLKALGSVLTNKYAEGYPGARYYEGNQVIDEIEREAQERLKKLFGVPFVNVQPYSGSPANSAVEFALLKNGETLMGLELASGGHLTHGHPKVTFSGRFFKTVQYGVGEDGKIDFDQVRSLARQHKPKLIIAGNTAYPFELDFAKFAEIADEVGAYLLADISHITGLVVAGVHMSPIPYADVVMTTTHKTFRGPRGAMILVTQKGLEKDPDLGKKINKAVFPALQGGPHNATTAAIAVAAGEALRPEYKKYGKQIKKNAAALAAALKKEGLKLVGDGTQTHLMLIDYTDIAPGMGGLIARALDVAGIYANKNTVPGEQGSPVVPSGLRLGTPLVTTRGMEEKEMKQIAAWIARVSKHVIANYQLPADKEQKKFFLAQHLKKMETDKELLAIAAEVKAMARQFPLFADKWLPKA